MSTSQQSIMTPLMRMSSSLTSSDDDDIEGGYSSNEDCNSNNSSADPREMVIMMSKLVNNGKIPRRQSQCEKLSFRRPKASLPQPPPSYSQSSSSPSPKRKDQSYHLPIIVTSSLSLFLVVLAIFVVSQQHAQVASLQLKLEIANQHRAYLEKSASDLHFKLTLRDTAVGHCNDAHSRMLKDNLGQGDVMRNLRQELIESRIEVERLKARDANVARTAVKEPLTRSKI